MSYTYSRSPLNERLAKESKRGNALLRPNSKCLVTDERRETMAWYKIYLKDSKEPIYRKGFSIKKVAEDILDRVENYETTTKIPREYKDIHHVWYDGHVSKLPHNSEFTRKCREHILNGEIKFRIVAGFSEWDLEFVKEHSSYFVVKDVVTSLDK